MASSSPFKQSRGRKRFSSVPPRSRAASETRSLYGDVDADLEKKPVKSRRSRRARSIAQGEYRDYFPRPNWDEPSTFVKPPPPIATVRRSLPPPSSPAPRAPSLPPAPMTRLSETKLLDMGSPRGLGRAASESRTFSTYDDVRPSLRRSRPRVVVSRRPAGNYYQRQLRKKGGRYLGRTVPDDDESDYTVLSDVDSLDGTYDYDDYGGCDAAGSSSVISYHRPSSPPSSTISSYTSTMPSYYSQLVSPDSPYFVDQNTEYKPIRPGPLYSRGLLELSPYDDDDKDEDGSSLTSNTLTSPRSDLSLSTYNYMPACLRSRPVSTHRTVINPYSSTYTDSKPSISSSSYSSTNNSQLASTSSSRPQSLQMLDDLVSSSVEKAKSTLSNLAVPAYGGAQLLLSVEGEGITPEGRRVGFTYTPSPIDLYGSTARLNNSIMALAAPQTTSSVIKPVDTFLQGYVERMKALRAELDSSLERDRTRRLGYEYGSSVSVPSYYSPGQYIASHEYVPVRHRASSALEQVPVTSYRRRHDDGRTHRMDVISLGEISPRSLGRAIEIPASATGGQRLTVLDKINIKVNTARCRRPPD